MKREMLLLAAALMLLSAAPCKAQLNGTYHGMAHGVDYNHAPVATLDTFRFDGTGNLVFLGDLLGEITQNGTQSGMPVFNSYYCVFMPFDSCDGSIPYNLLFQQWFPNGGCAGVGFHMNQQFCAGGNEGGERGTFNAIASWLTISPSSDYTEFDYMFNNQGYYEFGTGTGFAFTMVGHAKK